MAHLNSTQSRVQGVFRVQDVRVLKVGAWDFIFVILYTYFLCSWGFPFQSKNVKTCGFRCFVEESRITVGGNRLEVSGKR